MITITVGSLSHVTAIRVWSSLLPLLPHSLPLFLSPSLSSPTHTLRCYLKLGDWRTQLDERGQPRSSIAPILQYFKRATEYDGGWYKAWHAWAFMNFQAVLEYKQATTQPTAGTYAHVGAKVQVTWSTPTRAAAVT